LNTKSKSTNLSISLRVVIIYTESGGRVFIKPTGGSNIEIFLSYTHSTSLSGTSGEVMSKDKRWRRYCASQSLQYSSFSSSAINSSYTSDSQASVSYDSLSSSNSTSSISINSSSSSSQNSEDASSIALVILK
jgi:hypothetical protein